MSELLRNHAPLSAAAWAAIDDEATQTLKQILAARKLVDFKGPLGWSASAIGTGRVTALTTAPRPGVQAVLRNAQPLVELRVAFELSRAEMDDITRGAVDPDLDPVREAARSIALAEDYAVFHGYPDGGIEGIGQASADQTLGLTDDYEAYVGVVAQAVGTLRNAGVAGPYGIALGPRCYTGLTQTITPSGHTVITLVERLLDGPVIWAPGVDGAVVLSLRGDDFELTVGRDFAIGYEAHTEDTVRLYIEESMTFRVLAPEAAVPLRYR